MASQRQSRTGRGDRRKGRGGNIFNFWFFRGGCDEVGSDGRGGQGSSCEAEMLLGRHIDRKPDQGDHQQKPEL